jgi:hypothetical protein
MHLLIAFYLIISIITIYFQCNNIKSASNPTPTPSQQKRTMPTTLSYLAKKEPSYENWTNTLPNTLNTLTMGHLYKPPFLDSSTTWHFYPMPLPAPNPLQVIMMMTCSKRERQMKEKQEAYLESIHKMEEQRLQ